MTRKIYKSAMGKTVDLGALILENENVRAVGNMGVNARGDILDSANQTIDTKNRQVQRQYKKQATNTSSAHLDSIVRASKQQAGSLREEVIDESVEDPDVSAINIIEQPEPVAEPVPRGGLAAALAKSQAVKQELMKTPRQLAQERAGVKKI